MKTATAGRRVSESESSEEISSSSSDDSLLTDPGHLSLQPYMHEPPAIPSTYRRKVDQSASQHTMDLAIVDSLNGDSVSDRNKEIISLVRRKSEIISLVRHSHQLSNTIVT